MTAPRCFVLVLWLSAAGTLAAQTPPLPGGSPTPVSSIDDRAARLNERYKAMLAANPVEGMALDRLWRSYETAGVTAQLIDEYRHASEAAANDFAPSLLLGHFLKRAGNVEEAAAAYERAAKINPASPLPTFARAELALARSQPGEAAGLFETALDQLPSGDRRRAEWLLKSGDAWLAAGQLAKASEDWEKTATLAPNDLAMHRRLADTYEKYALTERAISHYEYIEAHADPAGRADALRELARLHEVRVEFDAARDALERGLALISRDNWLYGDLQTRLIRLYQRAGRTSELAARWQKAVEQAPRDLGGYQRLELLAEAEGDPAAERNWLEKIVALSPRDRDNTLRLARLLADTGEREGAAAAYDKLLVSQPGNFDLILARAELDVQTGHPDAAAARVEARLAQTPTDDSITTPALEFFLAHHLDEASEKLLREQAVRQPAATEPALALAKFLFSRRQGSEAHRVLDELTNRPGDPAARTARWMAAADAYKEQTFADDALRCWREAAALEPRNSAPLLAASDLLAARGDAKEAVGPLERALAMTPDEAEQIEVERKLFQVLQAAGVRKGGDQPGEDPGWSRVGPGRLTLGGLRPSSSIAPPAARPDDPLLVYIAVLCKTAADQPTAAHYLRLARWQAWAGETGDSIAAAEKAIEIDPGNIPAREFLVTVASDTHRHDLAEQRLREIMALDPSRRGVYLRQLAGLEAEDNDLDEALAIYDDLQRSAPGSVEALTDLALAQQRADRWYDALATWERAYALPGLTPAQKEDVRRPLLAAYERLDQFPQAAKMLQDAVDAQGDLATRQERFSELSAFCHKHDLASWLEKEYQTRLAVQPNDYFTLTASAALDQDAGRERDAYGLLQRAYFSSPDPAGSLRALSDRAEALGKNDEAISHQRRLTVLPGQSTAENLEKLADLQSANLDPAAAAHTWEQIVGKFPRDPNILEHGAEFFERNDKIDRARDLLRQVISLDANSPRRLYHLASLDADAGDPVEARRLLELLLARTDPEKPGDPLRPPPELDYAPDALSGLIAGMSSHRARTLGLLAPAPAADSDERHLRLDAVRDLSRLLRAGSAADRENWIERWQGAAAAGQRSEPLTAFFFTGEIVRTMDLVAGWLKESPEDERIRNTFLATGLRLQQYGSLAQWAWRDADLTHKAERGQWLLGALEQYLNKGGKPGPNIVAELFPPEVKLRDTLWEAAGNGFADRHWYLQAAQLGTRVYALVPSNRSEYALKIAQWELYLGNDGHARAVLRDAIQSDRSESFETSGNAVFAALRAYFLMLPEPERGAFVDDYLQRMRDSGEQAHATLAAVLLHGMIGDQRAAEHDLDDLVSMRMLSTMTSGGTPDARRWNYVLNNGMQLQGWNLDAQAAYYWRHALKEVSAFERQDGDATNFQTEIRGRLLTIDVATAADPQQARERVEEFLRDGPGWEAVANVAARLLAASQYPSAARLYETLCRVRPNDAEHWRNLFLAEESSDDRTALERNLDFLLFNAPTLPVGLNRVDLINRLANLREAEGDGAGACRLLEHAQAEAPGAFPLLIPLAQMEERAGRWDQAAHYWNEAIPFDPSGSARLSLAAVNERLGQNDRAIGQLKDAMKSTVEPTHTNAAMHLAQLFLSTDRVDEARALGTQLLEESAATALPAVAEMLAKKGRRPFSRELLAAAVRRTHDPHLRFQEQLALTTLYSVPDEEMAAFEREMHRLETFSRGDAGLRNAFLASRSRLARQRGADTWLETELKKEWADSNGDVAAGENLAAFYFDTKRDDGLRGVVTAIDHHPDLPEQTLHQLEQRLVQTGHGLLALPMLERLRRRFPQNEWYAQDQARALWQAGRRDEACTVLESLDGTAVFRDDLVEQVGVVYLELGDIARARQKFEVLARRDSPAVHYPQIDLQLARLAVDEHRLSDAHHWLRLAYRNPTCVSLAPIVTYMEAAGQLRDHGPHPAMPGGDIPLTFPRRAQLLADICDSLTAGGHAQEARQWVESHPEMLAGAPGLVATMRREQPLPELATLAALVETTVNQTDPPVPRLDRELAALYVQIACAETADPLAATAHLTRAHDLAPDDFDIAQQLAALCLSHQQDEQAAAALAGFLGPDALPAERARAQLLLGRSSNSTRP